MRAARADRRRRRSSDDVVAVGLVAVGAMLASDAATVTCCRGVGSRGDDAHAQRKPREHGSDDGDPIQRWQCLDPAKKDVMYLAIDGMLRMVGFTSTKFLNFMAVSSIVQSLLYELYIKSKRAKDRVTHDVSTLDKGFRAFADTPKKWSDQMVVVIAERDAVQERLQAISDREKEMEEWEKKLKVENSQLKADLESTRASLGSVNSEPESAHSKLLSIHAKSMLAHLELAHAELDTTNWIIETQESQIQRKRRDVSWLRKEWDSCLKELVEERKRSKAFEAEVTSVRATLDREKDYENGREAISQVFPDLDLSRVALPDSDEERTEDEDESTKAALAVDVPTEKATSTEAAPTVVNLLRFQEGLLSKLLLL
ncbi:hypothetical protein COCNU_scaffold014503G000010 [Cocos nucifera]|nr:hypothetical protein [Cocos nucifera]